jgi:hypothetical protein
MISRWGWVPAAAALCLCASCGAGDSGSAAEDAAGRFLGAVESGDDGAACAALAPAAVESLTSDGTGCAAAIADLDLPTDRAVRDTSAWSDRAQVRTGDDTLFLVEMPDGWRIAAAGCSPRPDETYTCRLASS